MNSRQENRSKLSFTARIITKYSLERFLSICGEKMSEGFLKFYKLIIKPDTRSVRSLSQILGAVDRFTFLPLNVNWTFRGGGGKAVDVSAGHFWTKAN